MWVGDGKHKGWCFPEKREKMRGEERETKIKMKGKWEWSGGAEVLLVMLGLAL